MKVLAILLLAVFTAGCNASFLHTGRPKSKLDELRNLFWESVDLTGRTVGDTVNQFEQTEFGRELSVYVKEEATVIEQRIGTFVDQIPKETKDMIFDVVIEVSSVVSNLERSVKQNLEPVVENWVWPLAEQAALKLTEEAVPVVDWLGKTLEPVAQYIQEQIKTLTLFYQSQLRQPPSEQGQKEMA